ncbi:hypothetical protein [Bilophila wadsworthia]|jgi:hypothetical protein|uniref:hypothetical protein n=2 Tax=Bilophila TaxID=35832 RepID=UPI0024323B5D|nr:hypothetical protein [Bilophila wadsworthia]
MRKLILTLVMVVMCWGMAFGEEGFDFRNVNWNAGVNEVREKESLKCISTQSKENSTMLVYQAEILETPCYIHYVFQDDKLIQGIYVFNEEGDISRVVLFRKIREMVSNKYDEQNKDMNKLMYGHVEVYVNKTTEITIVNKDKKIFVTYEPIKNTDNSSSKGENPF